MEKRIIYIDRLRALSVFMVILMHCSTQYIQNLNIAGWHIANMLISFAFTAVPIFFMISGALSLNLNKPIDINSNLKKTFKKLIIPLILWSIAISLIIALKSDNFQRTFLRNILGMFSRPVAIPLWFMYYMVAMYMITPFIQILVKHMNSSHVRYLGIIWIISLISNTLSAISPLSYVEYFKILPIHYIDYMFSQLGFFILGYYLYHSKRSFSKGKLYTIAFVDWLFIVICTYIHSNAIGKYSESFVLHSGILITLLSAVTFLIFKQNSNFNIVSIHPIKRHLNKVINFLAQHSYGAYFAHCIVLILFNFKFDSTWKIVINFPIVLISSFLISLILSSIPITCQAFLGLDFKNACNTCNIQYLIGRRA